MPLLGAPRPPGYVDGVDVLMVIIRIVVIRWYQCPSGLDLHCGDLV